MTETVALTKPCYRASFWLAVGFVFVLQLAAVFLADKPRALPAAPATVGDSGFVLGSARSPELAALEDPTLLVLANVHGFSGRVWMPARPLSYEPRAWTEPVQWLLPVTSDFFETFTQYVQDNMNTGYQAPLSEPTLTYPPNPVFLDAPVPSSLRIEGELAGRRLLNPEPLPAVSEALTNSVVQVVVDPRGYVYSAVPTVRSGSTNDDLAVRIAYSKRFEPIEVSGPNRSTIAPAPMMTGTLIFEWRPAAPETAQPVP